MSISLQHASGRAPVTMAELNVQLENGSIAEWWLVGGERVTVLRAAGTLLYLFLLLPGDWESDYEVLRTTSTDEELAAAIQAAYENADVTRDAVLRARRYA